MRVPRGRWEGEAGSRWGRSAGGAASRTCAIGGYLLQDGRDVMTNETELSTDVLRDFSCSMAAPANNFFHLPRSASSESEAVAHPTAGLQPLREDLGELLPRVVDLLVDWLRPKYLNHGVVESQPRRPVLGYLCRLARARYGFEV